MVALDLAGDTSLGFGHALGSGAGQRVWGGFEGAIEGLGAAAPRRSADGRS